MVVTFSDHQGTTCNAGQRLVQTAEVILTFRVVLVGDGVVIRMNIVFAMGAWTSEVRIVTALHYKKFLRD